MACVLGLSDCFLEVTPELFFCYAVNKSKFLLLFEADPIGGFTAATTTFPILPASLRRCLWKKAESFLVFFYPLFIRHLCMLHSLLSCHIRAQRNDMFSYPPSVHFCAVKTKNILSQLGLADDAEQLHCHFAGN